MPIELTKTNIYFQTIANNFVVNLQIFSSRALANNLYSADNSWARIARSGKSQTERKKLAQMGRASAWPSPNKMSKMQFRHHLNYFVNEMDGQLQITLRKYNVVSHLFDVFAVICAIKS